MLDIEFEGFDELDRKLQDLQKRAAALDGDHQIPLAELLPPEFMERHTRFATLEAMLEATGYEDFEVVPDAEWDQLVTSRTQFSSWEEMQKAAAAEWIKRQMGW